MSKFWGEWCKHLDQQEKDEKELRRQAALGLQQEHRNQMEHKTRVKQAEKDMELLVVGGCTGL